MTRLTKTILDYVILTLWFTFLTIDLFAQQTNISTNNTDTIRTIKNDSLDPFNGIFRGGRIGYYNTINKHLFFPSELKSKNNMGLVFYTVTIDTLGHIKNIKILRTPNEKLNDIVINALKKTEGQWYPKVINGKKEEYDFSWTVYFELR